MSGSGVPDHEPKPAVALRQHLPAVLAVCLAHTRNSADAEDLVQETFLKALVHIHDLRDPERVRPWLLQIARNLCINHHRRARPIQALPKDLLAKPAPVHPELEQLQAALAQLPEEYGEAVSLYYLDSKNCAEVASALGISCGAARMRLSRGRWMLQELMKESEP